MTQIENYLKMNPKQNKLSFLDSSQRLLFQFFEKGKSDYLAPKNQVKRNHFYNAGNRIYTSKGLKKPYFIHNYPTKLAKYLITELREELKQAEILYNQQHQTEIKVSLSASTIKRPYKISKLTEKKLDQDYQFLYLDKEKAEKLEEDEKYLKKQRQAKKLNQFVEDKLASYEFYEKQKLAQNDPLFLCHNILELVILGPAEAIEEALVDLDYLIYAWSFENKIELKELFYNSQDYFQNYSFLGDFNSKNRLAKLHDSLVIPENINQRLINFSQYSFGDETGLILGLEYFSQLPYCLNFKDSKQAHNILLVASSGSGKSTFMANFLAEILLYKDRFSLALMDWKGEYQELMEMCKVPSINFSETAGKYFDSTSLATCVFDPLKQAQENLDLTEKVFQLLLGKDWDELKNIFRYVLSRIYSDLEVDFKQPTSFVKSQNLTYASLYQKTNELIEKNDQVMFSKFELKKLKSALFDYFDEKGTKRFYFKTAINYQDFIKHGSIHYNLNMNKVSQKDNLQLALSQVYIMHLTNLLTYQAKQAHKLVFNIAEELNQLMFRSEIAQMWANFNTGGRSRGLINISITNAAKQIIDATRQNEKQEQNFGIDPGIAQALLANFSTVIVGTCSKEEMASISEHFNLSKYHLYLDELVKQDQYLTNNTEQNLFEHVFFTNWKGKAAMIKALIHPKLLNSNLFSNHVSLKD